MRLMNAHYVEKSCGNERRQIPYDEKEYRTMRSTIERFNLWFNIQKSHNNI
jgi:hypothetical protein